MAKIDSERPTGSPKGDAPEKLIDELRQELGVPANLAGESDPTLGELVATIDQEVAAVGLEEPEVASMPAGADRARHIVFTLGATRYAVAVGNVVEIGREPEVTQVPNVPEWVRGVSNLRGEIFAVLDSRALFGFEALGPTGEGRMLVVRAGGEEVSAGLIVDQVNGVAGISMARLAPPTAPIQDRLAPYLVGVEEREERLLAVLDLEKLLLSEEIRQFELQ